MKDLSEARRIVEQQRGEIERLRQEVTMLRQEYAADTAEIDKLNTMLDEHRGEIARLKANLAEAGQWTDPNDKTQKQFLPHIGERVLFCHAGKTYYGKHTGGSFISFTNPGKNYPTWECFWMYPPAAEIGKAMP